MAFHLLDLTLLGRCFRPGGEFFGVHEIPWPAVLDGWSPVVVVLEDALGQIFGVSHAETPGGLASQDVNVKGRRANNWWAWVDLNHRPHPYQGCALAT